MKAVVEVVSELAKMDDPRKYLGGMIHGLDIAYDLGEGHPLLGRRMPDLDLGLRTPRFGFRTAAHGEAGAAQPRRNPAASTSLRGRTASRSWTPSIVGTWDLPVLGAVAAPAAVLIRPDGYVAWVGDGTDVGLCDALATWCGPA